MITAWTKHLKSLEDKTRYQESLARVKWVLDDLRALIKDNLTSIEDAEMSPKSYDNANWQFRQAHANGYKQCLRDYEKLLNLDQKDKNG